MNWNEIADRVQAYRNQLRLLEETYPRIENALSVASEYELNCLGELRVVLHDLAQAIDKVEEKLSQLPPVKEVEFERD